MRGGGWGSGLDRLRAGRPFTDAWARGRVAVGFLRLIRIGAREVKG